MFRIQNWQQKLSYMAVGSVFTIIGMLFAIGLLSSVTAQRDKFGEIECTKLRVVDAEGQASVILSTNPLDGIRDENIMVHVIGNKYGGSSVTAYGRDRKSEVLLDIDGYGGRVAVFGKDEGSGATLSIDQHGGVVSAFGNGKGVAAIGINECGDGMANTWDKNGY